MVVLGEEYPIQEHLVLEVILERQVHQELQEFQDKLEILVLQDLQVQQVVPQDLQVQMVMMVKMELQDKMETQVLLVLQVLLLL
tara:strand:+ start:363 stop:614 length:252 start_codon:yes stop_codon:yes gene_type:complete